MTLQIRPHARDLAAIAGLAAAYFVVARIGLLFASVDASVSPVWPATGVAIGSLLAFGLRLWPGVFVGALLANLVITGSLPASLGIAVGNTLEALAGAWLVTRYARGAECFNRARDIFAFVALAALLATTASATIGVASLAFVGGPADGQWMTTWLTWWLGDAFGAVTTAPLIVQWSRDPRLDLWRGRFPELVLMTLTLLLTALVVFGASDLPLAFLTLPPIAWAAFRFSQREVATAVLVLSGVAIAGTLHGNGPFAIGSQNLSFLLLQAFIGTSTSMMLAIGALVAEQRATAHAAAVANRSKDEFLAMLSHELRNPLHALGSAAAVLQHPGSAPIPPASAIQIIRRQTEHLSRMVVDLLDVARAKSGALNFTAQPVDLAASVNKVMDELAAQGHRRTHDITASTTPVWAKADPVRVQQALRHLLANAVKFTPPGGSVRVEVAREAEHGVVRIQDSGVGMAPELQRRIFAPFAQGDRSIDRREGGLGLGLSLVRHFVEQQGGRVEAVSAGSGRGSTFVVRLPAIEPPPAATAEPATAVTAPARTGSALRILVVEDNDDARASLLALLKALGHEVLEAADGRIGVEQALQHRPDVGLIDIGLPEIDGYEVARRIRAQRTEMRLIALSGYARPADGRHVREAGFEEYLVKPVALEQLLRALGQPQEGR